MTTITADDGTKFELIDTNGSVKPAGEYLLRPLQPAEMEKKQLWTVWFMPDGAEYNRLEGDMTLRLTASQATALSGAIKALVEYVTNPTDTSRKVSSYERDFAELEVMAITARKAIQEHN